MTNAVSPRLPFGNGAVFVCRKLAYLHDDFRVVVCVSGTTCSYGAGAVFGLSLNWEKIVAMPIGGPARIAT